MLLSIFGTPSPLSYAMMNVLRSMIEVTHGPSDFIIATNVAELREKWFAAGDERPQHILFFSDCAEAELIDLFMRTNAPVVCCIDNLDDAACYARETRGMSLAESLRFATQTTAVLSRLEGYGLCFRVNAEHYRRPVHAVLAEALSFLTLDIDVAPLEAMCARLPGANGTPPTLSDYILANIHAARRPGEGASLLAPQDRRDMAAIVRDYAPIARGEPLGRTIWPTGYFLDWGRPGAFLNGPIDLLGPARFIVCGPYFHLPAGRWMVTTVIEVGENLSGNRLGVDVFSHEILTGIEADLPVDGVFEFDMEFEVVEPRRPVELRFQILEGAIEGRFALHEVRFERRDWGEGDVRSGDRRYDQNAAA